MSIENLFGRFCAGTVFAHDQEMSSLHRLRSKPRTLKRSREPANSQDKSHSTQSSQQPSVEAESFHQLFSTADALHGLATSPYRSSKRLRSGYCEEDLSVFANTDLPISNPFPKRKLSKVIESFHEPFLHVSRRQDQTKSTSAPKSDFFTSASSPNASVLVPVSGEDGGKPSWKAQPLFIEASLEPSSDDKEYLEVFSPTNRIDDDQGKATQHPITPIRPLRGSHTDPIGLPDKDGSNFDFDADGSEADRCYLLGDLPEPNIVPEQELDSQLDTDTQLTLSDSAFDTQSSYCVDIEKQVAKVQHRKDAYKAARKINGLWQSEYYLVSSGAHHGIEELEL